MNPDYSINHPFLEKYLDIPVGIKKTVVVDQADPRDYKNLYLKSIASLLPPSAEILLLIFFTKSGSAEVSFRTARFFDAIGINCSNDN